MYIYMLTTLYHILYFINIAVLAYSTTTPTHLINSCPLSILLSHSGSLASQLNTASYSGWDTDVLNLLRRGTNPDGVYYPLHWSCGRRYPRIARTLIQWGADVQRRGDGGWTPLHRACYNNNLTCVKVLLEHHSPTSEPDYEI